jgi:acetyl esterase/lipase
MRTVVAALVGVATLAAGARADDAPAFTRKRDVIYGRKYGLALTMDVFTPARPNGAAVVFVVSGGWFSRPENINVGFFQPVLKRGYTVFAVVHGSQPKFTIPEIMEDMHRAVRFIRFNAKEYGIDPGLIGVMGGSAGGHLSLLLATTGGPGDPRAPGPIDRASSKVRAACAFFPPTDFLNYGKAGNELIDRQFQPPFTAAMDYHEFDRKRALFLPVTDKEKLRELTRSISPLHLVTKDTAPTLLIHGDKDTLVPLQQSEIMLAKLKEAGVPAELIVKKGAEHGWPTILADVEQFADWFDKYLTKDKEKGKEK